MPKSILSFLLICLFTASNAQVINPSFEATDSAGKIAGWTSVQGKITRLVAAQFGSIPFTASHGNYFILLETDTGALPVKPALLEQTFAFADTPSSFYLDYLYIPENTSQHASFSLLFTRWSGTQRDTVMYTHDTIPVVANGNSIPIQWNTLSVNLENAYRSAALPDSAWISFSNDNSTAPGRQIRLYMDHIIFGKWAVGLDERLITAARVYPNPATDHLVVKSTEDLENALMMLTDISGRQYRITVHHSVADGCVVPLSGIPEGMYFFSINHSGRMIYHKPVYIRP